MPSAGETAQGPISDHGSANTAEQEVIQHPDRLALSDKVNSSKSVNDVRRRNTKPKARPLFNGNLSKEAKQARYNQASVFGGMVVAVELVCSLSGTTSIWPHMVAVLPGTLFVQQAVTAYFNTCFTAAMQASAVKQDDGSYLGA